MGGRRLISVQLGGPLPGETEVLHGAVPVFPEPAMPCDHLVGKRPSGLQSASHGPMQRHSGVGLHPVVGHLAHLVVTEAVAVRSVDEKPAAEEFVDRVQHVLLGKVTHLGEGVEIDVVPLDRQRVQHHPCRRTQEADTIGDDPVDGIRQRESFPGRDPGLRPAHEALVVE